MKLKREYGRALEPGMELYAIVSGRIKAMKKESRQAVEFLAKQEGFVAIGLTPDGWHSLYFYDSENNAKGARNNGRGLGIIFGNNISKFVVDGNCIPVFDEAYMNEHLHG